MSDIPASDWRHSAIYHALATEQHAYVGAVDKISCRAVLDHNELSVRMLQRVQRQVGEVHAALQAELRRGGHHLVRVAEGLALIDQVVGQVSGRRIAALRRALHRLGLDDDAGRHLGHDAQRRGQRVHRIERRLLVFLVVLVKGERLALHQRQQRGEVAVDSSGLAAREFGPVRAALLRHDQRAGAGSGPRGR
jgi:hypothetical protein